MSDSNSGNIPPAPPMPPKSPATNPKTWGTVVAGNVALQEPRRTKASPIANKHLSSLAAAVEHRNPKEPTPQEVAEEKARDAKIAAAVAKQKADKLAKEAAAAKAAKPTTPPKPSGPTRIFNLGTAKSAPSTDMMAELEAKLAARTAAAENRADTSATPSTEKVRPPVAPKPAKPIAQPPENAPGEAKEVADGPPPLPPRMTKEERDHHVAETLKARAADVSDRATFRDGQARFKIPPPPEEDQPRKYEEVNGDLYATLSKPRANTTQATPVQTDPLYADLDHSGVDPLKLPTVQDRVEYAALNYTTKDPEYQTLEDVLKSPAASNPVASEALPPPLPKRNKVLDKLDSGIQNVQTTDAKREATPSEQSTKQAPNRLKRAAQALGKFIMKATQRSTGKKTSGKKEPKQRDR